nr:hypothetical protein REQ54_01727 [Rhizobium sp. Q54]
MKRLKSSIAAWSALFAIVAFSLAAAFLPEDGVRNIAYSLVAGITAAGVIRWAPDSARAFRSGRAGPEFLLVGVFSVMAIVFLHRIWVMLITYFPAVEQKMVTHFVVWMLAWACSLILVAPDVEDGVIAQRSYVLIGLALFIAGAVSGATVALSLG